jgi:cell division protease FtsH
MMNTPERPTGNNPDQGQNQPTGPGSPMPFNGGILLWVVMGVLLLGWLVIAVWQPSLGGNGESVSYSAFLNQVDSGNVKSVTMQGPQVTGTFKNSVKSDIDTSKTGTAFTTNVP